MCNREEKGKIKGRIAHERGHRAREGGEGKVKQMNKHTVSQLPMDTATQLPIFPVAVSYMPPGDASVCKLFSGL
jgi:hypothetical protein